MQPTITGIPDAGASSTVQPDHSEECVEEPRPSLSQLRQTKYRKNLCDRFAIKYLEYPLLTNNWEKITNDPLVLETVKGHKPVFIQLPHQSPFPVIHIAIEQKGINDLEALAFQQRLAIHKVSESNNYHSN